MNRFRTNLHPKFFDRESGDLFYNRVGKQDPDDILWVDGENLTYPIPESENDGGTLQNLEALHNKATNDVAEDKEKLYVDVTTRNRLDNLLDDIITVDQFLDDVNDKQIQTIEYSHYGDRREQKKDQMRFTKRCNTPSQNANGEIYKNIWDKNNKEWYNLLLNTLKESGYFDDKNEVAEKQKIKEMYLKEVKDQYVKNVWFANDKDFLKVADVLFGKDSPDYPANKIYQKLTWAPTIFNRKLKSKESYNPSVVSARQETQSTNTENMKDKKKVDFLSKDFPDYLRSIKWTPKILNLFKWLPFVNAKIDQPSKTDKDAIKKFLNAALKLNHSPNSDPVILLLDALQKGVSDEKLRSNTNKTKYKDVLSSYGISVKNNNDWKDIEEVCKFYLKTQQDNQSIRDQHAIYLSVLQAIKNAWWIDKAVSTYKTIVDEDKKTKKTEKKEGYAEGKELLDKENKAAWWEAFLNFAKKLQITDFTYATRLFKLGQDYFNKNTPEVILANLNNNATIDPSDHLMWGSKTGAQFLNIFNTIKNSGGNPMEKLLGRAKLVNQVSWLGLDESVFTEESIKNWNKQLILLLQDIINKPWQELFTLMSEKETIEWVDLEQQAAYKKAGELVKNINFASLQKDGVVLASPTNMQAWLAAVMYDQFKVSSAGIAGTISFDEWAKWLKLDAWCQVGSNWSVVVWIGLRYDNTYNIGKWRTISQDLSGWLFVPIWENPKAGVWTSAELAKNWFDKNGVYNKLWFNVWYNFVGLNVVKAWIEWSRDKSKWIDKAEIEHRMAFNDIMNDALKTLMEQINNEVVEDQWTNNEVKLDFSNKDWKVVEKIREILTQKARSLKISEQDIASTVESTIRLLLPYDGVNIADENVRNMISLRVSEEYAMAWSENQKAEISKKPYLSELGVGAFWVVWTNYVWAYLNVGFTRHRIDGYWDVHWKDVEYKREWDRLNNERIQQINGRLWLTDENGLKFISNPTTSEVEGAAVDQSKPEENGNNPDNPTQNENGWYVQIPSNFPSRVEVLIDPKMAGLMAKDNDGNILLSPETPIRVENESWTSTRSNRLIIWRSKLSNWEKFKNLRTLPQDWSFANDYKDISEDKVLELREYDKYDANILNQLLTNLKNRPWNEELANLEWSQPVDDLVKQAQDIADKGKKVKIVVEKEGDKFTTKVKEGWDGRWLEIEYEQPFDMMDEKAQEVASAVYQEALKLNNPIKLYNVKHDIIISKNKKIPHRSDYDQFIDALGSGNYDSAKTIIQTIFTKLDAENKKIRQQSNFKAIWEQLGTGESLVQALMSINNIFARANSVKWNGSEYSFRRWEKWKEVEKGIWDIIASREDQILNTVKTNPKIDNGVRDAYVSLIEASKQYRIDNKDEFNAKTVKAAELKNTVWFNLWDKNNPENPLFNPEIYEIGKDGLKWFDPKKKEKLHEHAMRLFADNPHLIGPILEKLWFKDQKPTKTNFEMVWSTWKLTLEFWEWENKKIVGITADMAFGYFTQCVNHTVILNDLSAVGPDGTTIRNWVLSQASTEYSVSSIVSSTYVWVNVGIAWEVWNWKWWEQWSMPGNDKTGWEDPDYQPNLDF